MCGYINMMLLLLMMMMVVVSIVNDMMMMMVIVVTIVGDITMSLAAAAVSSTTAAKSDLCREHVPCCSLCGRRRCPLQRPPGCACCHYGEANSHCRRRQHYRQYTRARPHTLTRTHFSPVPCGFCPIPTSSPPPLYKRNRFLSHSVSVCLSVSLTLSHTHARTRTHAPPPPHTHTR